MSGVSYKGTNERTGKGPEVPTIKETRAFSGLYQTPVRSEGRYWTPSRGGRGTGSPGAGAGGDGRNDDAVSTRGGRRRRRRVLYDATGTGNAVDTISSIWANDRLLDQDIAEDRADVLRQLRAPLDGCVVYPVCGS